MVPSLFESSSSTPIFEVDEHYWQTQSRFFCLPPELRTDIYKRVLISTGPIELWPRLFCVSSLEENLAPTERKKWMHVDDVESAYSKRASGQIDRVQ